MGGQGKKNIKWDTRGKKDVCNTHTDCITLQKIDFVNEIISLASRPHIIIATPGRLADHIRRNTSIHLNHIQFLVFDEVVIYEHVYIYMYIQYIYNVCNMIFVQLDIFKYACTYC